MVPRPPSASRRERALAGLFLLGALGPACTPFKTDDARDASPKTGGCAHRLPPARPAASSSGQLDPLVFAVSETTTGTSNYDSDGGPAYQDIGFDLDDTCTGQGEGYSCAEPSWAFASHKDSVQGIDNAYGQTWWQKWLPDPQPATAALPTVLLRVSGYSGDPDDDQVDVAFYLGFLAPRTDVGGGGDAGIGEADSGPLWDGQDRWNVLDEVVVSSDVNAPRFRDTQAYVSNGVLVARFDEVTWSPQEATAPTLLVTVHQLVFAGSIVRTGPSWRLHDVVTGLRIGLPDATRAGAFINGICQDAGGYEYFKQELLCPYVDIATLPDAGSSAACDALSAGLLLEARPALLGGVLAPLVPPDPMCAAGIDPDAETCGVGGEF